jgi:chromosomal replication initiation ATPase DnaA
MAGQLVLPFGVEPGLDAPDFVIAPCNEQAVAYVMRWPDWPAPAAALCGPEGCGKSHLARMWRERSGAQSCLASTLAPDRVASLGAESQTALLIEDVDRDEPSAARDLALLALFERRGIGMLLTGRKAPSEWPVAVGDLKSRFQSLIAFPMWAPDDALLFGLVAKHFADRQIEVPEAVIRTILTHVERSPAAIAGFVSRLDQKALSEKRPISGRLVLELIASGTGLGADPP